jgi:hypothetical protein
MTVLLSGFPVRAYGHTSTVSKSVNLCEFAQFNDTQDEDQDIDPPASAPL